MNKKKVQTAVVAAALLATPVVVDVSLQQRNTASIADSSTISYSVQDDKRVMARAKGLYLLLIKLGAVVTACGALWAAIKKRVNIKSFFQHHGGWKLLGVLLGIVLVVAGFMTLKPEIWQDVKEKLSTIMTIIGGAALLAGVWCLKGAIDRKHPVVQQPAVSE